MAESRGKLAMNKLLARMAVAMMPMGASTQKRKYGTSNGKRVYRLQAMAPRGTCVRKIKKLCFECLAMKADALVRCSKESAGHVMNGEMDRNSKPKGMSSNAVNRQAKAKISSNGIAKRSSFFRSHCWVAAKAPR